MPRFTKQAHELKTLQDKWLYTFCHLHRLDDVPTELQETVFEKLFTEAKLATFKPQDRQAYEESLKYYRDLKNSNDTAHQEGREEERQDTAMRMLAKNYSIADTAELTGLSMDIVEKLKSGMR